MKARRLDIVGIFAGAYLIRLIYLVQISKTPLFDFLHLDPRYYHDWAARIAAGDWLGTQVFEQSPLYPYLLAIYMLAFGDDLWTLRLIQIAVGAVSCVLTYLLGRRLFDRRAGLLAAAGCALYGPFLFYEGQVMKEFLTPPLATLALLLLLKGSEGRARLLAAAGASIAAAALVRDNFLLLVPIFGAWLLVTSGFRLAPALAFAAGALALLLPLAVRNAVVGGEFVLTTAGGGEVFYIGNGPYANGAYVPPPWVRSNPRYEHEDFRVKAREMTGRPLTRGESSRFWWRQGATWIAEHPGAACRLWLRKLALFWNDHELPDNYSFYTFRRFSSLLALLLTFGPVAVLAAAGGVLTLDRRREMVPLYLAGAGYMFSVLLFFNFARFRLPIVPILLVLAGHALTAFWDAGRGLLSGRRAGPRVAAALVVAAAAVPFVYTDWSSTSEEPFQDRLHMAAAYRQAGKLAEAETYLRETITDAEALVVRHGGDPTRAATTSGGRTFVLALSAAHRDLAGILSDQGRREESAREYETAAGLSPDDPELALQLGAAWKAAGNHDAAARAIGRAVELAPDSFAARFDLATIHYEAGDYRRALDELQRARAVAADLPPLDLADYHYGMGAVLAAIGGRDREAAEHFTQALALNPGASQAGDARQFLANQGLSPSAPSR